MTTLTEIQVPERFQTPDCKVWSVFDNPVMIPKLRVVPADLAITKAAMRMTESTLIKYMGKIEDLFNKGEIVKGCAYFNEMKARLQEIPDEEHLIEIACVYSVLPGEDPEKWEGKFIRAKREIFAEDEAAKGFFLHMAYTAIMTLADISESAFLAASLQQLQTQELRASMLP